jgi:hypothetical protein
MPGTSDVGFWESTAADIAVALSFHRGLQDCSARCFTKNHSWFQSSDPWWVWPRLEIDGVIRAVQIARQVDGPVKVASTGRKMHSTIAVFPRQDIRCSRWKGKQPV